MDNPPVEGIRSFKDTAPRCPSETGVKCPAPGGAGLGLFPDLPGTDRPGACPQNWTEDNLGKRLYHI